MEVRSYRLFIELKQFWLFHNCLLPLRALEILTNLDYIVKEFKAKGFGCSFEHELWYIVKAHISVNTKLHKAVVGVIRSAFKTNVLVLEHYGAWCRYRLIFKSFQQIWPVMDRSRIHKDIVIGVKPIKTSSLEEYLTF